MFSCISNKELKKKVRSFITKEKYVYVGRRTFAIITFDTSEAVGTVVGFSVCNPKDVYNRKTGEEVAKGDAVNTCIAALYGSPRDLNEVQDKSVKVFSKWAKDQKKAAKRMESFVSEEHIIGDNGVKIPVSTLNVEDLPSWVYKSY